jgi:hypothetical protein
MNNEAAYSKMLRCTNKDQIKNVGRYLDIVKCKWFSKTKKCKYISIKQRGLLLCKLSVHRKVA